MKIHKYINEKRYFRHMKIGKLKLQNNLILAPMHGANCNAFRLQCKKHGAGLVFTSMIHPDSIFQEKNRIDIIKEEKPVAAQLVGKDPQKMSDAAKILEEKADIIDINLGCPDRKELANKSGAFLIKHPEQFVKMISKVVSSVNCPVTAKIRIGWDENSINAVEVSKSLEDLGVDAITVHGRTRKQGYTGKADWKVIKEVKEKIDIPVIGNGDVWNYQNYTAMLEKTKVDFVMIGRAAIGNPTVFEDCLQGKETSKTLQNANKLFSEFLGYYKKYSPRDIFSEIRQHAMWFVKGVKGSANLKNELIKTKSVEEIIAVLEIS